MAEIMLSEDDAKRAIPVQHGDRIVVTLKEFPSTGLSWFFEVSTPAAVAFQEDSYERSGPLIPGAGGVRRFYFLAVEPGDATLRFDRAYGSHKKIEGTLTFRIVVS